MLPTFGPPYSASPTATIASRELAPISSNASIAVPTELAVLLVVTELAAPISATPGYVVCTELPSLTSLQLRFELPHRPGSLPAALQLLRTGHSTLSNNRRSFAHIVKRKIAPWLRWRKVNSDPIHRHTTCRRRIKQQHRPTLHLRAGGMDSSSTVKRSLFSLVPPLWVLTPDRVCSNDGLVLLALWSATTGVTSFPKQTP